MNRMRFRVAVLLVFVAAAGCSSKVEVEYEREEVSAAVRAEDVPTSTSGWSRTHVRAAAERTVLEPSPPSTTDITPAAAANPPAEIRNRPVFVPPAPVITTIQLGDIEIHVGDVVHIESHTQIENDLVPDECEPVIPTPEAMAQSRQPPEISRPASDPQCEQLLREHEARVRGWEALFNRRR